MPTSVVDPGPTQRARSSLSMGDAMSTVQQAIEVSAPLHTVYEQLATFESYPRFMTGVEQVIQTSSNETHWIMDMGGQRREFDARIIECSLDQRVAWTTVDGPRLAETITLRPVGETRTQIVAQLEADAALLMPSDRHAQGTLTRRLKADLDGLKRLVERDGIPVDRQLSGTGTIIDAGASTKSVLPSTAFGSAGTDHFGVASPATLAARMRRRPAPRADAATTGSAVDLGTGETPGGHDLPMPGTRMGTARMGIQPSSADDGWGSGMINEEERGSAHDL